MKRRRKHDAPIPRVRRYVDVNVTPKLLRKMADELEQSVKYWRADKDKSSYSKPLTIACGMMAMHLTTKDYDMTTQVSFYYFPNDKYESTPEDK